MSHNILITGASGFVGKNLIPYLQNYNVRTQQISLREENWQLNISTSADAIIHLAGKAHDTKNTSDASVYFHINTELTKEVFRVFLKSNVRDFFYFSSVKAVADMVDGILFEDVIPNPQTPYGQSKLKAEEYLISHSLPQSKRLFIIRPCMIHGPGNKGNLNLLYKVVEKGIPYPLAAFDNRRSFLSIENLCFVIKEILAHPTITSGIYNVADDEPVSTNQLVKIIGQTINKKSRLLTIPKGLIQSLAKLGDYTPFPLNSERLKKLTENYIVSNLKIKRALGITLLPVSAEEGLRKTISSFMTE